MTRLALLAFLLLPGCVQVPGGPDAGFFEFLALLIGIALFITFVLAVTIRPFEEAPEEPALTNECAYCRLPKGDGPGCCTGCGAPR